MASLACNIVLLASNDIAQKAITASERLQAHDALFTLDERGPFPHVSLYMTQLKNTDVEEVIRLLTTIATTAPSFSLIADTYFQKEGYIDANYVRTAELDALQMTVIDAINPIRDGMRDKDKARLPLTEGLARKNLEQYGYRGVGELFRPHMTLTRFVSSAKINTSTLPPVSDFSGQFPKLGLFEMGANGTCIRKIVEFDFRT